MKNEECEHFWITSKYSKRLICENCGKLHPENELLYENNNLKQELSALKKHLKEIEFCCEDQEDGYEWCPACGGFKEDGHYEGCWINKAIKECKK